MGTHTKGPWSIGKIGPESLDQFYLFIALASRIFDFIRGYPVFVLLRSYK